MTAPAAAPAPSTSPNGAVLLKNARLKTKKTTAARPTPEQGAFIPDPSTLPFRNLVRYQRMCGDSPAHIESYLVDRLGMIHPSSRELVRELAQDSRSKQQRNISSVSSSPASKASLNALRTPEYLERIGLAGVFRKNGTKAPGVTALVTRMFDMWADPKLRICLVAPFQMVA